MKNTSINGAIGYIRISTKDQSTYSIPYQRKAIIDYCAHYALNLLTVFTDDGESSSSFDRPNWQALERFIKCHKGEVSYLIILDHDRFSRNLSEALAKIDHLEKSINVKVLSVYEPINTDTRSPDTFLNRAFRLLLANNELLRIREWTRRGVRLARESGRVVNTAPFGYKNKRDENDRPVIVVDPARAPIIVRMFEDFLTGLPHKKITEDARKRGFTLKGKSALVRVLTNSVYAGLVKVPACDDKPEKFVHGLHEPLIREDIFWRVQELLDNRSKPRVTPKDEVFLRGFLYCACGSAYTGSFSRGKSMQYYLYYRCLREGRPNYRADALHASFLLLLSKLVFSQHLKSAIEEATKDQLETMLNVEILTTKNNQKEIAEIERKSEKLEECLLNDEIEPSSYKKWYSKLREQRAVLQKEIDDLAKDSRVLHEKFGRIIPLLSNAKDVFDHCKMASRQRFMRKIFEAGLIYDGKIFSTSYMHPAFMHVRDKLNKGSLLELVSVTPDTNWVSDYDTDLAIDEDKLLATETQLAALIVELMAETIC